MNKALILTVLTMVSTSAIAQRSYSVRGTVVSRLNGQPVEMASVVIGNNERLVMTDAKGSFTITGLRDSITSIRIECLGYEKRQLKVNASGANRLTIRLSEASLQLRQVNVTASRKTEDNTTSYLIDRTALDNQQIMNIRDITTLLPGGKTVNASLMNDTRLSLHSGEAEKGNAAFGTAIELDGVRMQNNAVMGETTGTSTRNIASTNIQSVEVITGIPSVEYGDLSNGIVKVKTRRGKSPLTVSAGVNPYTRQIGAAKGFSLGNGILNASFEHTRSFSDLTSPHTSYQRNALTVNWQQSLSLATAPLYLNAGFTGNIGGMNSESDPDAFNDVWSKTHDYAADIHADLNWQLARRWINSLHLIGAFSYSDKRSEANVNANSSTAQPYLHGREAGYFIATEYNENPSAPVIMGPTGYWYVRSFNDSKPLSYQLKLKGDQYSRFNIRGLERKGENRILLGAELMGSGNEGRGTYYRDMRYAPSWREYRYDELPYMNNWAVYAEDRLTIPLNNNGMTLQMTAGLREDITAISHSEYGTVASLSPRFNAKYTLFEHKSGFWRSMNIYGGWGKAVKLPSFEVLWPSPSYTDRLAFVPTSTQDGRAFYAYNIQPMKAQYNSNLRWQHTNQWEIGAEIDTKIANVSVSAFFSKTYDPYIATTSFTPYSYLLTDQSALEGLSIPDGDRRYSIDRTSGVVTVSSIASGLTETLRGTERHDYNQNILYTNGSPIYRSGIDYIVDFKPIKAINTSLRLDGNYYHYRGVEHAMIASLPDGAQQSADGQPYQYIGYYDGTAVYGAGASSYATVSNGSLKNQANMNLTITTHIPQVRLIIALRLESSLYDWRKSLSEGPDGSSRGIVLDNANDYFGEPYTGQRDHYVAVYPEYYSTWDNPGERLPFAERFAWAHDNDQQLYNDLAKLVVKSNYRYNFNPDRISAYFSANLNITKEIGRHVSVSFLANNFLNSLQKVKSSRTGLRTTIYNTGYISPFYYGVQLRVKI